MKKYSIGFNVFDDSIELLEASISNLRPLVDKIYVVWQDVSNFGENAVEPIAEFIEGLKAKGLIDDEYKFKPKPAMGAHYNEMEKRRIGLYLAQADGMDYFMSMDSDEFYDESEFIAMKQTYIDEDLDSGYAQMQTYYKQSDICFETPEEYYVSLFYKVREGVTFEYGVTPVLIDPTRRQDFGKYKIFTREEIQMHHMSHVRKNIARKFNNSSASVNFRSDIPKLIACHESFDINKSNLVLTPGLPCTWVRVKKVEDKFKLFF